MWPLILLGFRPVRWELGKQESAEPSGDSTFWRGQEHEQQTSVLHKEVSGASNRSIVSVHKYVVMLHLLSCLLLTALWLLSHWRSWELVLTEKKEKTLIPPTLPITHAVKDLFTQLWKRVCICILNGIKKICNICCKQNWCLNTHANLG